MKQAVWLMAICFLLTIEAFAQSIDGKWTTSLHARNGEVITLTLRSDGARLTGTLYGVQPIPVEGAIDGNSLKLKLRVTTSTGVELLLDYDAILEGDEIQFTYHSQNGRPPVFGPAAEKFTAKRVT